MMVFVNAAMKEDVFPAEYAKDFLKLLCPIVPFITEEIWHNVFNGKDSISKESWPTYDEEKTKDDLVEIAAQINGKIVARLMINPQATTEDALAIIKENDTIKNLIAGKTIVKEIYVPGRIANIIVK
ncbi:MAG: class I tRNA ligase family protein, partial [Clostridia bacterium]|nr:class I tRNA ligase family protein [Clostridia bacterium]